MKYGFVLPLGDARAAADLAAECERAGWDGFFVWEPVWGWEAWILLAAAAMRTERIRLGTMLTPVSRMRPWKLAGETVTVDHLSNGRVILAVGLGAPESGFQMFGEETDRKIRAELLDEGLDIVTGLWSGESFSYSGKHYTVSADAKIVAPPPPPVQQPRIPIWVVGAWPRPKSMARALRYDGILPQTYDAEGKPREIVPDDFRDIRAYVEQHRAQPGTIELIMEGTTPGDDPEQAAAKVRPWAEAGATWWIEGMWETLEQPDGPARVLERARQGPPRLNHKAIREGRAPTKTRPSAYVRRAEWR